jgi:hypothetical protein
VRGGQVLDTLLLSVKFFSRREVFLPFLRVLGCFSSCSFVVKVLVFPLRPFASFAVERVWLWLTTLWYIAAVIFRRQDMKASLFYRIAAVVLLLFAAGHTLGFRQSDPNWGVDTLLGSMRSIHFDVQGFSRTYWDLFVAAGLCVGVFYLFAAILAWQLGGLPAETLARMRGTAWAFAVCFAAITVVSWRYLFILPIVFSMVITVCLIAAAWLSAQPS